MKHLIILLLTLTFGYVSYCQTDTFSYRISANDPGTGINHPNNGPLIEIDNVVFSNQYSKLSFNVTNVSSVLGKKKYSDTTYKTFLTELIDNNLFALGSSLGLDRFIDLVNTRPQKINFANETSIQRKIKFWHFSNADLAMLRMRQDSNKTVNERTMPSCRLNYNHLAYVNINVNNINNLRDSIRDDIKQSVINTYSVSHCSYFYLKMDTLSKIRELNIQGCDSMSYTVIQSMNVGMLHIRDCNITGKGINFFNGSLPDTLVLANIRFQNENTKIDLSRIAHKRNSARCLLLLRGVKLDNIAFNYLDYKLLWDNTFSPEDKQRLYHQLLEKFKKEGQDESYKNLEIEYKEFTYTKDSTWLGYGLNYIDKWWWNYGYDKPKIVTNSFTIFGYIILLNLLLFPLLFSVYKPDNFEKMDKRLISKYKEGKKYSLLYRLQKIPAIIAYSAYVFWGIKLDLDDIKFEKSWWAFPFFIFMIEYLSGIVCLAYIANLIITK